MPIDFSQSEDLWIHSLRGSCHWSSPGGMKYSISICSNSRDRKMKLRGVISLRKALPIWAIPKGSLMRAVLTTFLKLVKMPWAVSGRRYATADASARAPTWVWNMRLNSLGAVRAPGVPVAGEGIRASSSSVASATSFSSIGLSVPCFSAFFFIFLACFSAWSCMSPDSSRLRYPSTSPSSSTSTLAKNSWSALYLFLDSLQSTMGSENPST
mmetsp:Transcript_19604/g.28289  ORF Transcript_19604/g.28289 Transcript_19604/m.28289 type:complete len:212 (-) Transcript_19604:442-1077(-)